MKIPPKISLLLSLLMICPSLVMSQDKNEVKRIQKEIKEQQKQQRNELKERAKTPFVVILDGTPEQIKAVLVPMFTTKGYIIESDTPFQISFWTELTGMRSVWATMFLGNQYSENPRRTVQFNLSPSNGTTTLTCHVEVSVKMPFGKINRASLDHNPDTRSDIETVADQLKRGLVAGSHNSRSPSGGTHDSKSIAESTAQAREIPDATKEIEASTERVVALAVERFKREQIPLYSLDPAVVTFRHSPVDLGIYDVDLKLQKTSRGILVEAYTYRVMTTSTGAEMRIEALDFQPTKKTHMELGAYLQQLLNEIKVIAESPSTP